MINPELLEILCCPLGKAELKIEGETLICTKCGVIFPVRDNIPVLLIDEAKLPEGVNDISELKCRKEKNDA
jgi:uncharacterized protein YbaR (Trm112 family)